MNGDVKTKIIKRNGEEVTFDIDKIINAITKANEEVSKLHQLHCPSTLTVFRHYRNRRYISVALSLESPPPDVIRHPAL